MEVKNNHAYVTTQRILNKFSKINFSVGCILSIPRLTTSNNIDEIVIFIMEFKITLVNSCFNLFFLFNSHRILQQGIENSKLLMVNVIFLLQKLANFILKTIFVLEYPIRETCCFVIIF